MEQAISLAPNDPTLYYVMAELPYRSFQYEDAWNAIDEAIGLDPFDPALYFLSAKIAVMRGEDADAFSDLNDASLLTEGFMPWNAWETQAFVYLVTEEFEEAAAQYDSLFDDIPDSPHVLLGRAIAYAELDDDIALKLLTNGIRAAEEISFEGDPQLEKLYDMAKQAQRKLTE
jgi:tetratricopeptide (TPR) repeat protein